MLPILPIYEKLAKNVYDIVQLSLFEPLTPFSPKTKSTKDVGTK